MKKEKKSVIEKYAQLKLQKGQLKTKTNLLISIVVVLLLLIGFIYCAINGILLRADTTESILKKNFNASYFGYPIIKNKKELSNGYTTITIYCDSREHAMEALKKSYIEMSENSIHDFRSLEVIVCDKNDIILLKSRISIITIMTENWNDNMTYEEFSKLANIE